MNGVGVGSGYRGKERKRALGDKRGRGGASEKIRQKVSKGKGDLPLLD